jgi:hypothetical protein
MMPPDGIEQGDSAPAGSTLDPDALSALDTTSVCDLLARLIVKGESEDTILLCDEVVVRGDEAIPALKTMLSSGNRAVATVAMRMLLRIGTVSSVVVATERVVHAHDSAAEMNLIKEYSNIQSHAVDDSLVNMARLAKSEEDRECFSRILRNMEGTDVIEALAKSAASTDDPSASEYCCRILAGMNKPSGIPALEGILDTGSADLQAAAASALATIGNGKACELLANHASSCSCCIDAIAQVRSPYAQKTLLNLVRTDGSEAVRNAALIALSSCRSPELASQLASMAADEKDEDMKERISKTADGIRVLCKCSNGGETNTP